MADPVLHIKDSYYFEVPKALWPRKADDREFPEVWVSLDPQYQDWEFVRLFEQLAKMGVVSVSEHDAEHQWHEWMHADHVNAGKPFDVYLEEYQYPKNLAAFREWQKREVGNARAAKDADAEAAAKGTTFVGWLKDNSAAQDLEYKEFSAKFHDSAWRSEWQAARNEAASVDAYVGEGHLKDWSPEKVAGYNQELSGKIIIPQPFGRLRNLYEKEAGWDNFAISKFMILELVVGLIIALLFSWLARRVAHGAAPKGKLWNLLETFCVFVRDEIAEPAIGHHDAHRFTPLLWNIFFFILGMNLFGMIPWVGAPTGSFGVTIGLAMCIMGTVLIGGMLSLGPVGFWKNMIPPVDLGRPANPLVRIFVMGFEAALKLGIFAIEVVGLAIRHLVLAIRLLANMVAGHLVLLGVMGLAFGAQAALTYASAPGWQWGVAATVAVIGSTLFSILELFVAFLQAYIFTFLAALFIGSAVHEHH
jgi:F-type H+-transporting ATPase subunit a